MKKNLLLLRFLHSKVLCLAESIIFTEKCEKSITENSLSGLLAQLQESLNKYTNIEFKSKSDTNLLQLKYKALIMDVIHYIDVVEQLQSKECKNANEWSWQKQLRFYLNPTTSMANIRMVDAQFSYTYEYQGNAPKLVHTPLTDKCYLTLTQSMHMGFGGNPYGPAGTGKTESVKALGVLFGRQVLVFNCDEVIFITILFF
jgi:dynein heavy chain 2